MSKPHLFSRLAAAATTSVAALALTAGAASAVGLPTPPAPNSPVPAPPANASPLEPLRAPVTTVTRPLAPVRSGAAPVTGPVISGTARTPLEPVTAPLAPDVSAAAAAPSSVPAPVLGPLVTLGTQVKSGLTQLQGGLASTPLAAATPSAAPGGVVNVLVSASPLATACAQVTGSGTALANMTITVGGQTISAPLVEALPGVLAPCPDPATAGPVAQPPGTVVGVIAGVTNLVGACIRITSTPPLQATILVLNNDLIAKLTQAGVPLQQLVVPCPSGVGGGGFGGGGPGGGGTGAGTGVNTSAASALRTGLHAGATGSLPRTGADLTGWLLAAAGLLVAGGALMASRRALAMKPVNANLPC